MNIKIINESSEDINIWEGNPERLVRTVYEMKKDKFPYANGISLYEDTYFNSRQVLSLIEELKQLKNEFQNSEVENEVASIIDFIKKISIRQHVVFVGD